MDLIHRTLPENYKGIKKKGLLKGLDPYPNVRRLEMFLEPYRPKYTHSFINVADCIWFTPINTPYKYLYKEKLINLVVDSKKLTNHRLYYVPIDIEIEIYNLTNEACESGDKEKLGEIMESKEFIDLCKSYWENLKPFSEYEFLYDNTKIVDQKVNVLYFGNIPPKIIRRKIF